MIEVKPRELCTGEKFNAKIYALEHWATINGYSVIIADQNYLCSQCKNVTIDYNMFDEKTRFKIKKLYETSKKN